MFLETRVY